MFRPGIEQPDTRIRRCARRRSTPTDGRRDSRRSPWLGAARPGSVSPGEGSVRVRNGGRAGERSSEPWVVVLGARSRKRFFLFSSSALEKTVNRIFRRKFSDSVVRRCIYFVPLRVRQRPFAIR